MNHRLVGGLFFWIVGIANVWLIFMTQQYATHWAIVLMDQPRTFVGLSPTQFGLLTGAIYAASAGCCIGFGIRLLEPWMPDIDIDDFGRNA